MTIMISCCFFQKKTSRKLPVVEKVLNNVFCTNFTQEIQLIEFEAMVFFFRKKGKLLIHFYPLAAPKFMKIDQIS